MSLLGWAIAGAIGFCLGVCAADTEDSQSGASNENSNKIQLEAKSTKNNIQPVMILLEEKLWHSINGGTCVIPKVGIIGYEAYVYDEVCSRWYKVNLLGGRVEHVGNLGSKNWVYKTAKEESILKCLANTIGVCAMMWSGSSTYQIDDVLTVMTGQLNRYIEPYRLRVSITRERWITRYNKQPISLNEIVHMISEDEKVVFEVDPYASISIDDNWIIRDEVMQKSREENTISIVPEDTAFFKGSIYVCPSCKRFVNKVLLQRSYVNVGGEKRRIDKSFSCKYCGSFYAPILGRNLNAGSYYYLNVSDDRYKEIVREMDQHARPYNQSYKDPTADMKFLNFIKAFDFEEVMCVINDVYREMKGTCGLELCMGKNVSITFAGMMLLWKYISLPNHISDDMYCEFLIELADIIGGAFNHLSPMECTDRIYKLINRFPKIMSFAEWIEVNDHLEEYYRVSIRACEFNIPPIDVLAYDQVGMSFIKIYNELDDMSKVFDYYEKQGLGITRALWRAIG